MASPSSAKRVLKRQKTMSTFHCAEDWLTVWSDGKEPVAVGPPKIVDGVKCVAVGANTKWLKKLSFNHATWQKKENHYVKEALRSLCNPMQAPDDENVDLGAAALGHSSDDEQRDGEQLATLPRHRGLAWNIISVAGVPAKVKFLKGHQLLLELRGEVVIALCELVAEVRRREEKDESPDHSSFLNERDEGRITYSTHHKSFQVMVTVGTVCGKKLAWPVTQAADGDGDDVVKVLGLARAYWNQFDTSGEARYRL
jgi:hypothetical protein